MRAEANGLNDFADQTFSDQLSSLCNRGHFKTFGKIYGPNAASLPNARFDPIQLLQRCAARFVGHHVFTRPHRLNSTICAA